MNKIKTLLLVSPSSPRRRCRRMPTNLCSVRISDYAGHEGEIDWTKTEVSREEAYSINLVDKFCGGCGMKELED